MKKEEWLEKKIKKNVPLARYTTIGMGGRAKYFFEAKSREEIIKIVLWAKEKNLPFFILGGGSNLLISDKGYNGLAIRFHISGLMFQDNRIIVGAGRKMADLVRTSSQRGLAGLEWAAGIPGTVGGAIAGNAGAFGRSMEDITEKITILDIGSEKGQKRKSKNQNSQLKVRDFNNKQCRFGYRESIFKKRKNLIILSAFLKLKKRKKGEIRNRIKRYLKERREKQPLGFPSIGSVFKNEPYKKRYLKKLKNFPLLENFKKNNQIPAAWLIEQSGLKGKRIGDVKVSEKQANFIINLGKGKARDVRKLMGIIKKEVRNKFGIVLKEEILFIHT